MLPAIVDKKNKDKDAPEIAPPAAPASAAAPAESSKGGSAGATSSAVAAAAASTASAPTAAQPGRPGPAIAAPSPAEMQGQIASSKGSALGSPGGNAVNAGTADADYKSEGLKNAQPNYPLYARKMNQEGVVILSVEVLTDGSAGDVRVATSSGIRLLDKSALEAVKEWNFKPARKDGIPYVQRLRIPIIFSLSSK
jgi:protein TonB